MDLSLWSEENNYVSWFRQVLLSFGGRPYRCEYCRCNFVSFRARKERFSFHRWARRPEPVTVGATSDRSEGQG